MAPLCKWLALASLVGFAAGARAGNEDVAPVEINEPEAAVVEAPEVTPAVWGVLAVCLAVSVSAGGYTFFCYLRRRDTLSTLAALEDRYRHSPDFE